MQKLMGVLMLSTIVMGLWSLPAIAITGQIDGGVQVNQAICVNSTTSTTSTGAVTGTTFDCGVDFPAAPGDQITIVLVGTGGTGGPAPSCNTTPIPEQEPNDDPAQQSQDIGTLQSGGCITVAGSTDTGFGNPDAPDPNADRDHYLFSLVGVSRLRIDFDIAVGQTFLFGVFDADTGAPLEDQGPPDAIEVAVPVQTNRIVFRILTDVPSSYTLTFSDRSGTGTPPLGALTSGPRKIEQHP